MAVQQAQCFRDGYGGAYTLSVTISPSLTSTIVQFAIIVAHMGTLHPSLRFLLLIATRTVALGTSMSRRHRLAGFAPHFELRSFLLSQHIPSEREFPIHCCVIAWGLHRVAES